MTGSLQIKKRKNGEIYYAVLNMPGGKKKWINLHLPVQNNKRIATEKLTQILAEYQYANQEDRIKFIDACENWKEYVKPLVKTVTYTGYAHHLKNHIIPYFENKILYLDEMTPRMIEAFFNYELFAGRKDGKEGGMSPRAIRLHYVLLNQVMKHAFFKDEIEANPCDRVRLPRMANKGKKINFYSVEESKEVLNALEGSPVRDMVEITLLYGLRRSELLGIQWSKIDYDNYTIEISHTVILDGEGVVREDSTKTKSSERVYPLLPEVKAIFVKLKKQQDENRKFFGSGYFETDYVLTREDGTPYYPDYPSQMFRKIMKKTNLPVHRWHDLRHSTASILLDKGWSMKDVSEWLGHSGIGITMNTYAHVDLNRKRKLSLGLENMFSDDSKERI